MVFNPAVITALVVTLQNENLFRGTWRGGKVSIQNKEIEKTW